MKNDKHIKLDLNFLDKEEKKSSQDLSHKKELKEHKTKYNWKKIFIVCGVVLFIFIIIFSEDGSSTSYTSSTNTTNNNSYSNSYKNNNDLVETGEYWCTSYHNKKATELEPRESLYKLELERTALDRRYDELDSLWYEIEYSTVSEYSYQWQIDEYNDMVEEYNTGSAKYDRDVNSLQSRIDKYNKEVDVYNNYLIKNCDPK
jgi:hypothetical protein